MANTSSALHPDQDLVLRKTAIIIAMGGLSVDPSLLAFDPIEPSGLLAVEMAAQDAQIPERTQRLMLHIAASLF
jgi:hypothetical protein